MKKRIAAAALVAGFGFGVAGTAVHADGHNNGVGNGQGCTLANGDTYKNPAAMLKALTERDGSFQTTIDLYPGSFDSVGDLINQKCGL